MRTAAAALVAAFASLTSFVVAAPRNAARGTYEISNIFTDDSYNYPPSPTQGYNNDDTQAAPPSPPAPPPATSTQYVVVGGSAGLVYTPSYIYANIGDVVIFTFGVKNHTVTQSSFAQPCVAAEGGADSGFMPTDGTNMPTFAYTVNSTSPTCTLPFVLAIPTFLSLSLDKVANIIV
jgi:plastocyanin